MNPNSLSVFPELACEDEEAPFFYEDPMISGFNRLLKRRVFFRLSQIICGEWDVEETRLWVYVNRLTGGGCGPETDCIELGKEQGQRLEILLTALTGWVDLEKGHTAGEQK